METVKLGFWTHSSAMSTSVTQVAFAKKFCVLL